MDLYTGTFGKNCTSSSTSEAGAWSWSQDKLLQLYPGVGERTPEAEPCGVVQLGRLDSAPNWWRKLVLELIVSEQRVPAAATVHKMVLRWGGRCPLDLLCSDLIQEVGGLSLLELGALAWCG